MRELRPTIALTCRLASLLALCSLLGCQGSQPAGAAPSNPDRATTAETRITSATHDLSRDEGAGGHTLRKHVGRTDGELRERLRRERNIAAASTWTDRATAEAAVGAALQQNREGIERWRNRSGGHPNFVIEYDSDRSLGRSLRRDGDHPVPCSHATIVLKWSGPNDYYVLTSYPECRS